MSGENLAVDTSIDKRDPGVSSTNPHQKVDINNLFAKLKNEFHCTNNNHSYWETIKREKN